MSNDKENNKDKIDRIIDAPAASASITRHNDIKSQSMDVIATADDTINIVEPSSPTHSQYPYNKQDHSLSGHLKEVDDTPGAERLMEMHRSGTFYEIHPDGTKVTRIYGDNFEIALSDNNMVVGGNLNITVQGNSNILTKGNVKHKIGGNLETVVHGNMTTRVEGNRIDYTKGNHDIQTLGSIATRSEGKTDIHAKGELNIQTQSSMIMDSASNFTQYCGGKYTLSIASSFNVKSGSNTNIDAGGTVYIDGSAIRLNEPGPGVSSINPATNDPTDKDPTGGLIVPDSVTQPTVEAIYVAKSDNPGLSGLVDSTGTLPKDRTPIGNK